MNTSTGVAAPPLFGLAANPGWLFWVCAAQAALIVLFLLIAWLRRSRRELAQIGEDQAKSRRTRAIDAAQMAVIIPGIGATMGAYAICTFEGMVAFAEDKLEWHGWLKYVPWSAYDVASIVFTLLGVYAVRHSRPGAARKAYRAVAVATVISASIQLWQGGQGNTAAGGVFLGCLAGFGGYALHTFIDAITDKRTLSKEEAEEAAARKTPAFGQRWLWASISTALTLRCWHVHPPKPGTPVTVEAALDNRKRVRAARVAERGQFGRPWLPIMWVSTATAYAERLKTGIGGQAADAVAEAEGRAAAERAELIAQARDHAQRMDARMAELADAVRTAEAERDAARQQAQQNRTQVGDASAAVESAERELARVRTELADAVRTASAARADAHAQEQRATAAEARADALTGALADAASGRVPAQGGHDRPDASGPDVDARIEKAARLWLDGRAASAQKAAEQAGIPGPFTDALRKKIGRAKERLAGAPAPTAG